MVLAVVLIGPERLPGYAEQLGHFVRRAKRYVTEARSRVDEELGPEFKDVDWSKLDPRQYDPRKIVREALMDEPSPGSSARSGTSSDAGMTPRPARAPYDDEAT